MFLRIVRKIGLLIKPPKKGDIFHGDPVWFIIPRPIEMVLHGLKDKFGTNLYDPIPSKDCFRFTIEQCGNEIYILNSEVLCRNKFSDMLVWMKRTQPRRIGKDMFEEMFLNGLLWRMK